MDDVTLNITPEVYEKVSKNELTQLDRSIKSLIKAGILMVRDESDVQVDMEFVHIISLGSHEIQEGYELYGQDEHGFVVYPFNGE